MAEFVFQTVPLIHAGPVSGLAAVLQARSLGQRPLVVSDPGVVHAGLIAPVMEALTTAGFVPALFDQVVADPPVTVIEAAVAAARAHRSDCVIGLGGGSAMDTAKLVAVLAPGHQSLEAIYGIDRVTGSRLPLVLCPTTAGTGSEVTPIAIVTTGETVKMGVVAPQLYADLAWLDADLTLGLPKPVTAATGIDAMVHAIEAYTSRHRKNPLSDALAREALRLLDAHLEIACADGGNRAARAALLRGAMLAGQAFANAPVAAVHALAYPIGGIFHVPHGLSNALVLTQTLRFNLPAAAALYAELSPATSGSAEARALALIDRLETLATRIGLQRRLRDVGIAATDVPRLAAAAMDQTRLLVNNPRPVQLEDAQAIYEAAW